MNCNYKVKITDIQNKYQFKILCKGGANSTNVNDIYNLLPTTTTEGTDVSVANTSDIKAKAITIKGNTTQDGTPTPASPIDVLNVTGLNTITVSNSDNSISKDFIINFGNLEFAGIGTYRDYPFKENNKWYKYNAIKKKVLDGTEDWTYYSSATLYRNTTIITDAINNNTFSPYCNYYKGITYNQSPNRVVNDIYINYSSNQLNIVDNRYTSADDFKTWLSTHNVTLYYALETPTITEITDTTLIKQLNNISNNIRTFEGGTNISSTSAGANPIINITTFNKLS